MSAHKNINTALAVRLQSYQTSESPPIAWENDEYEPTEGTLYLRENFLPSDTAQLGLADADPDDYLGIYQVTVVAPSGERRFDAQDSAVAIAAHFARGTELTQGGVTVRIRRVQIERAIADDAWYRIPISIYWRAQN